LWRRLRHNKSFGARLSLEKEEGGHQYFETFLHDPVGNQAHLVKLAGSQKPSLRSLGVTRARSVGGEHKSRAIEPRKVIVAEAFVVTITGAAPTCRNGLTRRLDRGPRTGQMCGGSSRNLGGLADSTPSRTGMGYRQKSLACVWEHPYTRRSEQNWMQAVSWYCLREGNEAGRDGGETS